MTDRAGFEAGLDFALDDFQRRALDAIDAGHSVLVAAPTGSGKTVPAEYAVGQALARGGKAFYTTPLKALSNQKYGDFVRSHGAERVGLLTGDNAINGDAPVVVMTTEVLRNMIYAGSALLDRLRYVILDEVHYLQNPYRGAVWEEVIIHTPPEVDLVCLSATVSNAEEFAAWITTVRGTTTAIIEERRPVQLHHLYLVGDRSSDAVHLLPTFVDERPNPEVAQLEVRSARQAHGRVRPRSRLFAPRRAEVVDILHESQMLPAIYFVFSRAGCDDAVRQCLDTGLRLTTPEERDAIREIAETRLAALPDEDLEVLSYSRWLAGLEAGFAAHHAGMVPPFKEVVEAAFTRALVKVVFATETLSLGINMPARSVVIEKLTKFTGDGHEFLTPGEYTQLTGRAGRRGIDDLGYAVVLWSPFVPFDQVAGLASRRTYELTSSFRPTYNMAVNLVHRYPADTAHHLLNLSFAQYRADSDVVRLESHLERQKQALAEVAATAHCERGDAREYAALIDAQRQAAAGEPSQRDQVLAAMERIKPGDVLVVPGSKSRGRVAVLTVSHRRASDIRLRVVAADGRTVLLGPRDFAAPPRSVGRVELPTPYTPNKPGYQRTVARALQQARLRDDADPDHHGDGDGGDAEGGSTHEARRAVIEHPVAGCPDAAEHVVAWQRTVSLRREVDRLETRIRSRTESLARQFDRVLRILESWGYVDGWALTDAGRILTRLYHECDLLVTECVRVGLFDDLTAEEVAGLASMFTYELRGRDPAPTPRFPTRRLRERWESVQELAIELGAAEDEAGLPETRRPDAGFVALAHGWAAGEPLEELLTDSEMSGGDFVRNVKQLIDLVRQLGEVAPDPATADAARSAAGALFHGVVAASSAVDT